MCVSRPCSTFQVTELAVIWTFVITVTIINVQRARVKNFLSFRETLCFDTWHWFETNSLLFTIQPCSTIHQPRLTQTLLHHWYVSDISDSLFFLSSWTTNVFSIVKICSFTITNWNRSKSRCAVCSFRKFVSGSMLLLHTFIKHVHIHLTNSPDRNIISTHDRQSCYGAWSRDWWLAFIHWAGFDEPVRPVSVVNLDTEDGREWNLLLRLLRPCFIAAPRS